MKQRPILFNTEMIRAILSGSKQVTRRIVKDPEELVEEFVSDPKLHNYMLTTCPYGVVGDVLYVREAFTYTDNEQHPIVYRADIPEGSTNNRDKLINKVVGTLTKWKPGIHLPKKHSRIWLKVRSVGIERLRNIKRIDAVMEGIKELPERPAGVKRYKHYTKPNEFLYVPELSFFSLWESIHGDGSIKENPFVWVVKFERIQNPNL